jgi:hypothetical protein
MDPESAFIVSQGHSRSKWVVTFIPPDYMLVTCPALDITLLGLPRSVLSIQPKTFTYRSGQRKATFHQFPVTMAYSITDYKCQSLTFEQLVVDLKRAPMGFAPAASAYVPTLSVQSARSALYNTPLQSIRPYHDAVQGIIG